MVYVNFTSIAKDLNYLIKVTQIIETYYLITLIACLALGQSGLAKHSLFAGQPAQCHGAGAGLPGFQKHCLR
jgi:hypothetical protein